jgi:hypothetical protein
MGAIQDGVLGALGDAGRPMRRAEVHRAVELRLQRKVSVDTVGSFLSVAARNPALPVVRVKAGLYDLLGSAVLKGGRL